MERIKELKEEAYKIATASYYIGGTKTTAPAYNAETRLRAMEVYARLISAEQCCIKENNRE